jgi:hypothetical protein
VLASRRPVPSRSDKSRCGRSMQVWCSLWVLYTASHACCSGVVEMRCDGWIMGGGVAWWWVRGGSGAGVTWAQHRHRHRHQPARALERARTVVCLVLTARALSAFFSRRSQRRLSTSAASRPVLCCPALPYLNCLALPCLALPASRRRPRRIPHHDIIDGDLMTAPGPSSSPSPSPSPSSSLLLCKLSPACALYASSSH